MTSIWFPDFDVVSAGGLIRLELSSPYNEVVPNSVPFQSNFTYRAVERANDRILWERRQSIDEHSPRRAWIDDSGWAVVATIHAASAKLIVISPDGSRTQEVELYEMLG